MQEVAVSGPRKIRAPRSKAYIATANAEQFFCLVLRRRVLIRSRSSRRARL